MMTLKAFSQRLIVTLNSMNSRVKMRNKDLKKDLDKPVPNGI